MPGISTESAKRFKRHEPAQRPHKSLFPGYIAAVFHYHLGTCNELTYCSPFCCSFKNGIEGHDNNDPEEVLKQDSRTILAHQHIILNIRTTCRTCTKGNDAN